MKSESFCYWLQGYFELGSITGKMVLQFNDHQVQMVQKHLDLVFAHEKNPWGFCHWLEGFLQAVNGADFEEDHILSIQNRLSDVFLHRIDPSLGEEAHIKALDKIHNGPDTEEPKAVRPRHQPGFIPGSSDSDRIMC